MPKLNLMRALMLSLFLIVTNVYADTIGGAVNDPTVADEHLGVDENGNPALLPGPPTGANPGVVPTPPPNGYLQQQQNNKPFVDNAHNPMMEKCHVLDQDGNGMIKAYSADSGPNLEGDATAWIWVPRGECQKMNNGDFSGVSQSILNRLNLNDNTNAQTFN